MIPVYENSHFFQGYIAQGARSFVQPQSAHAIMTEKEFRVPDNRS